MWKAIPTPTTDYALIRVHLPHGGGALLLELYDALGRKLSEQRQQPSQAGVVPFLLAPTDLGELPAGTYIYRVLWENRKASGVLIKVQ